MSIPSRKVRREDILEDDCLKYGYKQGYDVAEWMGALYRNGAHDLFRSDTLPDRATLLNTDTDYRQSSSDPNIWYITVTIPYAMAWEHLFSGKQTLDDVTRSFNNNDGTGQYGAYDWTLNDTSQDSYDSRVKDIEATLMLGVTSQYFINDSLPKYRDGTVNRDTSQIRISYSGEMRDDHEYSSRYEITGAHLNYKDFGRFCHKAV